jgi:hypothetical protein
VSKTSTALLMLTGAALTIAIVGGMGILWRYSLTPGGAGTPPALWPTQSRLARKSGSLTLVMTVHPHCHCTRASIGELEILMAQARGRLDANVIFAKPSGFSDNWTKTSLWRSAAAIPGVSAVVDDGREARLFGAATSGQTMVYDRKGHLVFSGGITAARGHYDDNAGVSAIATLLDRPTSHGGRKTAVYGCALFAPRTSPAKPSTKLCPQ